MNTIVGVARLGVKAGAVAAVGEDPFREYIIKEFKLNNIDTSHVIIKKGKRTTLAFVINEPFTGARSAERALEFGVGIVGIKLGAKGALIRSKDGVEVFAPP
jgi:sugar/nucleoside kinase (ribokinase family)